MVIVEGKKSRNGSSSVSYEKARDSELENQQSVCNGLTGGNSSETETGSEQLAQQNVNCNRDDIGKDMTKNKANLLSDGIPPCRVSMDKCSVQWTYCCNSVIFQLAVQ